MPVGRRNWRWARLLHWSDVDRARAGNGPDARAPFMEVTLFQRLNPNTRPGLRWAATLLPFVIPVLLGLPPGAGAQPCPACTPLTDLAAPPHLGYPMGLYPGGSNTPPAAHLARALAAAAQVVPRDAAGAPSVHGLIGFLSIGMSNTNQEFAAFERAEDTRVGRNPRLILLDGAFGGQSAEVMVNPAATYWTLLTQRLAAAGLDADQVQAIWLKQSDGVLATTAFPAHADTFETHLRGIVRLLKDRFPNLALCYLSSRIYGGYTFGDRGEPLSYESAFGVRGLIEDQINGDPSINPDPAAGSVEAPLLLWGPYLWANGATPRPGDGLVWNVADLESDHVHPSPSGEAKVAGLLDAFLAAEPTAAPWRDAATGESSQALAATADAWVDDANPTTNHGLDPLLNWVNPGQRAYLRFDLGAVTGTLFHAKLSLKTPPDLAINRADVYLVTNTTWGETSVTSATAPPFDGGLVNLIPGASRGTSLSLDVTNAVAAALASGPGARISLGLRLTVGGATPQQVISREGLDGPRLVLSRIDPTTDVDDAPPNDATTRAARLRPLAQPFAGRGQFVLTTAVGERPAGLELFDLRGRLVRSLGLIAAGPAGELRVEWDGRTAEGHPAPAGVYFARIAASERTEIGATCRVVLVRP